MTDIILETVRELLPEIEQSLREEIHSQLRFEYSEKFQKEINTDESKLRI